MVILKYLYWCLPVYISHSILGFTFIFLNSRAALFKKVFLFPFHFSQFIQILINFRKHSYVFFTVAEVHLPWVQASLRQQYPISYRYGAICWFQAHHTSQLITAVPLLANASHVQQGQLCFSPCLTWAEILSYMITRSEVWSEPSSSAQSGDLISNVIQRCKEIPHRRTRAIFHSSLGMNCHLDITIFIQWLLKEPWWLAFIRFVFLKHLMNTATFLPV